MNKHLMTEQICMMNTETDYNKCEHVVGYRGYCPNMSNLINKASNKGDMGIFQIGISTRGQSEDLGTCYVGMGVKLNDKAIILLDYCPFCGGRLTHQVLNKLWNFNNHEENTNIEKCFFGFSSKVICDGMYDYIENKNNKKYLYLLHRSYVLGIIEYMENGCIYLLEDCPFCNESDLHNKTYHTLSKAYYLMDGFSEKKYDEYQRYIDNITINKDSY